MSADTKYAATPGANSNITSLLGITGTIQLPAGSAGTPAINFGNNGGDTNTGISSPGADQLTIGTSGTARVTVSNSGFAVGAATPTGNGNMLVKGTAAYGQLFIDPSATANGLTIMGAASSGFIVSNGNWDGSNWTARSTGPAAFFGCNVDGGIRFYQGASTTAGSAFSITQVFEIFNDKTIILTNDLAVAKTITAAGTTGAQTIHKTSGSVNFAAGATSLVVTNNKVTTSSVITATVATNDSTMKSVAAVAAAGIFTLHANAAATAETRVNFIVTN